MKYQIEYCPNPDCIQIHVNKEIFVGKHEGDYEDFLGECNDVDGVIKALSEVEGIESVSSSVNHVQMTKGKLFAWDDLLPKCIEVIKLYFPQWDFEEIEADRSRSESNQESTDFFQEFAEAVEKGEVSGQLHPNRPKTEITLEMDNEVLEWLKNTHKEYYKPVISSLIMDHILKHNPKAIKSNNPFGRRVVIE